MYNAVIVATTLAIALTAVAQKEPVGGPAPITFADKWADDEAFSAAILVNGHLVIGSDEKDYLQVGTLKDGAFGDPKRIHLPLAPHNDNKEIDVEALAYDGEYVYALGSHASTRTKVDAKQTYETNWRRLLEVQRTGVRERLYRFRASPHAMPIGAIEAIDLKGAIAAQPVLKRFFDLPSKEGGVDMEGLAVDAETDTGRKWLYAGFRGPVLRHGFAPVLRFQFSAPEAATLLLVPLDGRGIRDMVKVHSGFLILAGPVGDSDQDHRLYWWNGKDCVVGAGSPGGQLKFLGSIDGNAEVKAEALLVHGSTKDAVQYDVDVLFDGVKNGGAKRLSFPAVATSATIATNLCGGGVGKAGSN